VLFSSVVTRSQPLASAPGATLPDRIGHIVISRSEKGESIAMARRYLLT
jgi:hypothetical protein